MPITTVSQDQVKREYTDELLPMGIVRAKLAKFKLKTVQYSDGPAEKIIWMFDAVKERRKDDSPYRLFLRTGKSYGNENAELTKVIDWIYEQHFTEAEYGTFDLEALLDIEFDLLVGQEKWADKSMHNVVTGVKTVDKSRLPAPPGLQRPLWETPRAPKASDALPAYAANAAADDEQVPLTDKQRASLIKRLKLSPEEADQLDMYGNSPGDEGYTPLSDPFVND